MLFPIKVVKRTGKISVNLNNKKPWYVAKIGDKVGLVACLSLNLCLQQYARNDTFGWR